MIILEGFDGAGKSTLAAKLKFPVKHAGGPPKTLLDLISNLKSQSEWCGQRVILDRVTCISHQVYGNAMWDPKLLHCLREMMKCKNTVLVYCRPPNEVLLDFSKHEVKGHDSTEHLEMIEKEALTFISRYDEIMSQTPHVKYDYLVDGNNSEFIKSLIHSQVKI